LSADESGDLLELAVECDSEAAEAVSELFNRYNGGGYQEDSEAGEASGGGAVIEATGFDDFEQPVPGLYKLVVKTYLKPGARGVETRRLIEDGLWRLSLIYPIPEAQIRVVHEEDWANAWKKFYKPLRIGKHVVLKPTWESWESAPGDLVVHLDPGMAFGTGMHPTTRLCVAALEECVRPGDRVLDVGTGSGVLAIVALRLGAQSVLATDIDTLAVRVASENAALNSISTGPGRALEIRHGSVPGESEERFQVVVANILAEVLVGLFDGRYGDPPLAEPLAPGGTLIMSGILEDRAAMVEEAAARHGLTISGRQQEGDWVAVIATRPA
jgi:ribosomal protein L11 methyltransferase